MMANKPLCGTKGKNLSRRSKELFAQDARNAASSEEVKKLVYDLETYQTELEIQNEELCRAQEIIEASRSKYTDLYDFAPVGYFTFDDSWRIQEVNLTGAAMLGVERSHLMNRVFPRFVKSTFRDILFFHRKKVLEGCVRQTCELMLIRKDGSEFHAAMESMAEKGNQSIRSVIFDITQQKLAENRVHQLFAQLMAAQETERKRIASEIHDSLAATLSALKYKFESKIQMIRKGEPLSIASLEEMISVLQGSFDEVLRIMNDLRPSTLDDLGLLPTLNWLFREYEKVYPSIQVEKQLQIADGEIPDLLKILIFRIVQEALINFARHGRSNRIRVSLDKMKGKIRLSVQDNGQGFDPQDRKKGLGLDSMRERVESSGGIFELESAMGTGTTIRASWPRALELT